MRQQQLRTASGGAVASPSRDARGGMRSTTTMQAGGSKDARWSTSPAGTCSVVAAGGLGRLATGAAEIGLVVVRRHRHLLRAGHTGPHHRRDFLHPRLEAGAGITGHRELHEKQAAQGESDCEAAMTTQGGHGGRYFAGWISVTMYLPPS